MSSEKSIITIVAILSVSMLICVVINPKFMSLEAFVLAIIAAYLAGIYTELKHSNKKPKDEQK